MSQYRIVHTTGYRYEGGATDSFNEARMTPLTSRRQLVLSSKLDITPVAWTHAYRDYWGTSVVAFEIHEAHADLNVVATSTVDIHDVSRAAEPLGWDGLADAALRDRYVELLTLTGYVRPHRDVARLAEQVRRAADTPADAVGELTRRLRERVGYLPGVTQVHTTAAEVWEHGAGVCQDLAHLTLGGLRAIGIPARYVSGYVVQRAEPEIGEAMVGESHAWIQFYDGEWLGFDPTSQAEPRGSHVEVGFGRDYADVAPLKGIYTGSGGSEMYVSVEMTRLT
ncbi:transglutaminase [Tessaracoccus lapidicaptus]|uniref:Transglutaminase n=1 Tax=Tessaracoccus lapidicaptus TaxID=1427523 RepID=A0A1C0APY4_9ACTN|nr:transglutaminase family protein [Tessaracoccus lapidicaptus]OCL36434.1 transglutaminase [Tessaracoccus lapidicaptus]